MIRIYSRVDPKLMLHLIITQDDFEAGRTDIVDADQFLQCALLHMEAGKTFRPHKHLEKESLGKYITQESWHVISGRVRCKLFDIDDRLLAEPILNAGDTSFTFAGGHTYEILLDGTKVLEYKNGPYHGQQKDKIFI